MKFNFHKALWLCVPACLTLTFLNYSYFRDLRNANATLIPIKYLLSENNEVKKPMKYILQWTSNKNVPFVDMGTGQSGFIDRKCKYVNCYVTSDKQFLGDYTNFDVIAFAGTELMLYINYKRNFPERRSVRQKYVFGSIESSDNYKICTHKKTFDGYFNWTWTYKLDSEVQWGYIIIRDKQNNIIGPKKDMHWLELKEMDPVPEEFKKKLKTKKKAAAWFVSNCMTRSGREIFFSKLQNELSKYKLQADMFGDCGELQCPRDKTDCDEMIAEQYYFYLAFENAFSEDYVTEKLIRALNNDAIPIVFGGANYTRFMPDGIYLNAVELGTKRLAAKMNELINDPDGYANYFKWRNHYSYHRTVDSVETNEYCRFCELLNDEEALKKSTVYKDFENWWNPKNSSCHDRNELFRFQKYNEFNLIE